MTTGFTQLPSDPTLVSGEQQVIGSAFTSTVSFARTADTNAYTAGDVIGIDDAGSPGSAIHTFTAIGRTGGAIQITTAELSIANTSIPAGMTSFRLHLYTAAPAAILDNAAFSAAAGDRANYRGFIDFTIGLIDAGFLYATADYIGKHLELTTSSLFGVLVTNGGYTPASGTTYAITLRSVELG
jgi:hypothetical protein